MAPPRNIPPDERVCGPCEQRRQRIAEARKSAGIKGVVKSLPMIARDVLKNPPTFRKRRNG